MGLEAWAGRLSEHRRAVALVGLIVAFTGVSMVLNPTHAVGIAWFGLPVVVVGFALFAWVVSPQNAAATLTQTLGARFLHWITWRGRLTRLLPVAGITFIASDLVYNLFLSASSDLLTEDVLVLSMGATLLGYGFVPPRFSRERDFVFLFFVVLDAVLVAPLLVARALLGTADASVDVYSWAALAPELGGILALLGVANTVHPVAGFTAPGLTFTPVQMSVPVTLVITTSCSGIYSFGIFASGYIAFLLTEYEQPSRRLWLLLGLGFLASYAANLLRMLVIVLVGYYTDSVQSDLQNLLLAHSYAGWIIFLGWIGIFWGVLFKFVRPEDHSTIPMERAEERLRKSNAPCCVICRRKLSPLIPASRCTCGAYYHWGCLEQFGHCPACYDKPAQVPKTGGIP